ncbi:K02A2.6-like [Cordylochernes scorpioides]|uniref:RNA-directed DNA polymerase n=1 Tax=Cordylochernes scorpioides TaxID=51811 RepID=A0ABY6JZ70_9ARAC|nr:K02A2.6-like [Cordylochernes scorpioides]
MERSLEQRYAIKFCVRLGKNTTETFQMLQKVFKDDCISRSQSGKWHKAFKEGREEVADEPRSGRPTTARTDENVDRVLEVLRTDRRLSIQQIADTLHMSTFVVHGIVTEDLQMRKVCAKLVPKVLSQDQKELRILRCQELLDLIQNEPDFLNSVVTGDESWMFEYDPESKIISTPQESANEQVAHQNAFYLEVLRRLKRRIARVRTNIKDTVKLHHDNATSHTAFIITNFLARSNTPVIPHPSYSPDLAPCDLFLLPRLKREMKGKHWETVENTQHHVTTFLRSIPVEEFQGAFQAWQTRLRKDTTLREKYLQNPDLALSLAINQGQAAEASQKQLRNIEKDSIDAIRKNFNEKYKPTTSLKNSYTSNPVRANFNKSIRCSKCNMAHDFGKCPAYGKECYKCRRPNHFSNCCKYRAVRCIQEIEEEKDNLRIIDSIMVGQVLRKPWKELIYIQGHPVDIKLDTGADANILPERLIKEWPNMPLLETADCKIYTYTGQQIPVVGKCQLDCKTKYACRKVTFLIVNNSAVPILGLDECEKLNLVKRVETISDISVTLTGLLDEYKDVFKGNGHLSYMYDIKISDKAEPKISPARRLPRALLQPVKEELFKMEEDGIIEKIEEPTVWAHPMVVVKKPSGKYRICIDPRKLNKWVLREHYTLPAPENILAEIPKAKFYSVLDAKSAFWQVPLNHNSTLKKVLDLARESRLKLTLNKLQMATGVVKFLGHTISQEGILPDQDKVRAIQNMQIPKNKQELQRILGTVTYLAKFIPDLSSNTSNMRNLLKKDIIWNWNIAADQELNFIKTLLTSPPVLRHFDPNEPLELFADASKDGLGAILMQKEKPLSYASASLTSPQKHYSQIEKELLALYFGCKRFHYFLYGRKFTAYTHHKPLVSLLKKNFDQMSPRLQRLSLYLLNYQFELKFIPGKSMIPADTLSRHLLPQEQMEDKELDLCTQTFVLNVEIKDQRLTRLQEDTLNDKECCLLKQYILTGWPLHKRNLPSNLKPYWEFKEELHEWQNLICRGNKLLIPKTQRSDMLKILHASHQGINNTIALAKRSIYWPGMNKEIEELINNCSICQQTSKEQILKNLCFHTKYLIIHGKSKYPEIYQLQDMTTDTIIRRLKRTFSNFGIQETLVSDNGPPFFSKEFQNFTRTWNIVHVTSSPYHAQSNGMVELTVQTLKKLIKRCGEESTDPYLALLNLRNTPHNNLPSPAQILMSRNLRLGETTRTEPGTNRFAGPGGIPIAAYIFWTTLFSWIPGERDHHRTPGELYQWFPREPDHHQIWGDVLKYLSPEQRSVLKQFLDMEIVEEICPTSGRDIIPDDHQWDSSDKIIFNFTFFLLLIIHCVTLEMEHQEIVARK